jgi:hypothetical protein
VRTDCSQKFSENDRLLNEHSIALGLQFSL